MTPSNLGPREGEAGGPAEGESAAIWVPIGDIHPWEGNPRKNDDAVKEVAKSMKRFGFGAPLLVRTADREVIAGHTRLKAAVKLGLKSVPVRFLDLDPAEAHLLALADNKTGELADWDDGKLGALLDELRAQDADLLTGTGFDGAEIDRLIRETGGGIVGEDPGPGEPPADPVSRPGELYELGPHRLMCGDATKPEDVRRVMGDVRAQLLWTDPPYNVAYEGGTKKKLTIENDSMEDGAFRRFLAAAFTAANAVLAPGACFYVAHADTEGFNFRGAVRDVGWKLAQCVVWVKDAFVLSRQDYHWRHEPILFGWKPGAAHRALEDRTQDTVWEFPRPRRSEEHPTMKPPELIARAILNSSGPGEHVLDTFAGSGSTLIAAAQTGRVAHLLELSPQYVDVIRIRWTKYARSAGIEPGAGALEGE